MKKLLHLLSVFLLTAVMAVSVCACTPFSSGGGNGDGGQTENEPSIQSVYGLYVENCAKTGQDALTYDDWLATVKGEKGDQGEKGEPGASGNGWHYGSGAPSSTLGAVGDLYLDYTSWNVYSKENSGWAQRGNIKGEGGGSWLYGGTAPADNLGKKGDLYLDYTSWNVYTKENGGWTLRGNIKGPAGGSEGGNEGGGGSEEKKNTELDIYFPELGNGNAGDCTLLKTGNTEVLIDAGSKRNSAAAIVPFLTKYCTDGVLEYVIVTHAHEDHIAAFVGNNGSDGVFANFKCGTIIDFARTTSTSKIYSDYVTYRDREVSADGATHYTALECWNETDGAQQSYTIAEGLSFEILYQKYYETKASSGENNYSVCTLFTHGENHYLFTGDLELEGEQSLVESNDLPRCKLFKAGHHGSKTSSNEVLLSVIQPEYVCISCCAGSPEYSTTPANTFPTQETLNRIAIYTKNIYVPTVATDVNYSSKSWKYTSLNGLIDIWSDGSDFTVMGSNNSTILKETDWFKANRTWPANGVQ